MLLLLACIAVFMALCIFILPSKQESLGTAFLGDKVYTSPTKKLLKRLIFISFFVMVGIAVLIQFM